MVKYIIATGVVDNEGTNDCGDAYVGKGYVAAKVEEAVRYSRRNAEARALKLRQAENAAGRGCWWYSVREEPTA